MFDKLIFAVRRGKGNRRAGRENCQLIIKGIGNDSLARTHSQKDSHGNKAIKALCVDGSKGWGKMGEKLGENCGKTRDKLGAFKVTKTQPSPPPDPQIITPIQSLIVIDPIIHFL